MTANLQARTAQDSDAPAIPVFAEPIRHPSAWTVADFGSPADWSVDLNPVQLRDIAAAMRRIKAAGIDLNGLQREHFEVPSLRPVVEEIRRQVEDGRGFVLLRRLPVEDYSKHDLGLIFWGIGTHLGRGLSQSVMGDRLGHVKDFSREDPGARAYRNKQELSPHTDSCDLVGLLCLRNAQASGGVSRLTSAISVHNALLAEHPDVLAALYRGYVRHRRGEEQPGELPYTPHRIPVYSNVEGKVSARYVRSYIEAGETAAGRPMGPAERAIIDTFEAVTKQPELMLEFMLQPGEAYFINNYTILHARTAFDDGDAPEDARRHLLRLWLDAPIRPVHPYIRSRGILPVAGRTPSFDWGNITPSATEPTSSGSGSVNNIIPRFRSDLTAMTGFPDGFSWRKACAADAVLRTWAGPWSVCFAIKSGNDTTVFNVVEGQIAADGKLPAFTLSAPEATWGRFLEPVPPRHHHGIFAMMYRLPEFSIQGDELVFMQHAHIARRVLEVGKWLALGRALPVPVSLHPREGARALPTVAGRYVPVTVGGVSYQIYSESAGSGQDVLCMHTAGADGRQFHGLMADPRIVGDHRLVSFDLPWHGKSPPPEGAIHGSWRLNTELYVALILGFIAAAELQKPVALGASMSGEICLELAFRHPEAFAGIIACEACDKINQRQTGWAAHPHVNQAQFVPEWIRALSAPQSPAEYVEQIAWHYGQGGPQVFFGDIAFYSGEWDARERVGRIDTNKCPLFMLTGEYDYSCTVELSEATAAKIPGVRFQAMQDVGHFPFAENPKRFAEYLLPILAKLKG